MFRSTRWFVSALHRVKDHRCLQTTNQRLTEDVESEYVCKYIHQRVGGLFNDIIVDKEYLIRIVCVEYSTSHGRV